MDRRDFTPPGGIGSRISDAAAHRCVRLIRFAGVQNREEFFRGCEIDFIDCIAITDYNSACPQTRSAAMASITIRNLDDDIKQRLRVRAAEHGRSMEMLRSYTYHQILWTKFKENLGSIMG